MCGIEVHHKNNVRIFGVPINEDGRAETWMTQTGKSWRQILILDRRVTSKSSGAEKDTLRILVNALLISKVAYEMS